MVHIGLIGAGNISDTHARAATAIPGVAIAAVHAPTLEHAQHLAACHGAIAYDTLEGLLTAAPDDWIIRGVKGELYSCKPDVFALTYEAVDEEAIPPGRLVGGLRR